MPANEQGDAASTSKIKTAEEDQKDNKLDEVGELEVRALAKTKVRRSLDLKGQSGDKRAEKVEVPSRKMGWVEVPGVIHLEWQANPWRARPKRLAVLSGCLLALYVLSIWLLPGNTLMMILVPFLLVGSASAHLVPSTYVVTDEGVYWSNYLNKMFKPWIAIEDFIFEDEMGELFFDSKSIRNRIQRSIPVYYKQNRTEVEEVVRQLHSDKWNSLREEVAARRAQVAMQVAAEEAAKQGKKDERQE